jgi:hypothetical protein
MEGAPNSSLGVANWIRQKKGDDGRLALCLQSQDDERRDAYRKRCLRQRKVVLGCNIVRIERQEEMK